jgi:hypothetical protein
MKSHVRTWMGMAVVMVCVGVAAIEAQVADVASYRVDMEFVEDGERVTMRRYIDGPRSRIETVLDGETFITIELGDAAGTTYVLMPEQKQAMKMTAAGTGRPVAPAPAAADSPSGDPAAGDLPLELVATETIDGKAARKYRVRTAEGDGFVWLDVERELPLRMESGGQTIDMKNYDFAPQPPELFQVPKGYEVTDLDQMMRSAGISGMALRGAVGAAGAQAGAAAGGGFGASVGASLGGAVGGPIGAMIGGFLGQSLGKKAGQKAGAAAAGAVVP